MKTCTLMTITVTEIRRIPWLSYPHVSKQFWRGSDCRLHCVTKIYPVGDSTTTGWILSNDIARFNTIIRIFILDIFTFPLPFVQACSRPRNVWRLDFEEICRNFWRLLLPGSSWNNRGIVTTNISSFGLTFDILIRHFVLHLLAGPGNGM